MSDVKSAVKGKAVAKSDTVPNVFRALYVGTSGDLVVQLQGDSAPRTFKNAPIGYHPLSTKLVMNATTAADIVGLL
jgi:hypothetical protein